MDRKGGTGTSEETDEEVLEGKHGLDEQRSEKDGWFSPEENTDAKSLDVPYNRAARSDKLMYDVMRTEMSSSHR